MIQYDQVSKVFGSDKGAVRAVDRVSMLIPKGKVVVLLGPSGCGKTTLLRMTNRLVDPTGGAIRVNGADVAEMDPVSLRRSMGYVIQQTGLFPNKTITQNVAVVPRLLGWDQQRILERVHQMLFMVNLEPEEYKHRYPAELSGGEQQRVGVARALAGDPGILLMDEPFGALDPINREQLQDEFLRLQARLKKTVIFVSHDIQEAMKMGDIIAIFQQGSLVQAADPLTLLLKPKNQFIKSFVGADRALKALGLIKAVQALDPPQAAPLSSSDLSVRDDTPLNHILSAMLLRERDLAEVKDAKGRVRGLVSVKSIRQLLLDLVSAREGDERK